MSHALEAYTTIEEKHPTANTDELARFRREWEAEVKRNRAPSQSIESSAVKATAEFNRQGQKASSSRFRPVSQREAARRPVEVRISDDDSTTKDGRVEEKEESNSNEPREPIRLMRRAVECYAQAVESERSGRLDEALILYRKAFRLDSNVDRLFERSSNAIQSELENGEDEFHGRRDVLVETEEVRNSLCKALDVEDYRYRAIKKQQQDQGTTTTNQKNSTLHEQERVLSSQGQGRDELSALINKLSIHSGGDRNFEQIGFVPGDEEQSLPIAKLPEEVLLHILSFIAAPMGRRGARIIRHDEQQQQSKQPLQTANMNGDEVIAREESHRKVVGVGVVLAGPDYMSIEQLGRTCWKFRLLTRAWSVWRLIVRETYFPPQIPIKSPLPAIVETHDNDWRTTFVEQPRVRLNGAYIAACHYTRPGMHEENVWIRVVHVVEFYRSLRFLPDGRILSLLTTDTPSLTVRKMEPSLRVKGFAIGTWKLHPKGLADDELFSRPPGPKIVVDDLTDKTMSRYKFRLVLKLDTTSRGKWNRMEVLEYESLNLESGEICPLPLNHKKPFHFSTVRSYGI